MPIIPKVVAGTAVTKHRRCWQETYQCTDILQIGLSKVGNDVIQVLKGERLCSACHLDCEGGAQFEVAPCPPRLLPALSDVLMQEQPIAIWASVQLHNRRTGQVVIGNRSTELRATTDTGAIHRHLALLPVHHTGQGMKFSERR